MRALEWFAGIGGWHYALISAFTYNNNHHHQNTINDIDNDNNNNNNNENENENQIQIATTRPIEIIGAFDISTHSYQVYSHNFNVRLQTSSSKSFKSSKKSSQSSNSSQSLQQTEHFFSTQLIETLTLQQLLSYNAQIWFMSPPCQPFSRAGVQKDDADPRCKAFLHIINLLTQLSFQQRPLYIFLENVCGFEHSRTLWKFRDALTSLHYVYEEFILSPLQFGIPNQRRRYYAVAKLLDEKCMNPENLSSLLSYKIGDSISSSFTEPIRTNVKELCNHMVNLTCRDDLNLGDELLNTLPTYPTISFGPSIPCYRPLSSYIDNTLNDSSYQVPENVLNKGTSYCFDIVDESNPTAYTQCFTSSYSYFNRGTGSIFRCHSNANTNSSKNDITNNVNIDDMRTEIENTLIKNEESPIQSATTTTFRFFTPNEIARLHEFPASFSFPAQLTLRQQYGLLGNSLNVEVASRLISYALLHPCGISKRFAIR
jgi:tRNA (cytosine38-C5)-methyltransferase